MQFACFVACNVIWLHALFEPQVAAAYQFYLTALDVEQEGPSAERARRGLRVVESRQKWPLS